MQMQMQMQMQMLRGTRVDVVQGAVDRRPRRHRGQPAAGECVADRRGPHCGCARRSSQLLALLEGAGPEPERPGRRCCLPRSCSTPPTSTPGGSPGDARTGLAGRRARFVGGLRLVHQSRTCKVRPERPDAATTEEILMTENSGTEAIRGVVDDVRELLQQELRTANSGSEAIRGF